MKNTLKLPAEQSRLVLKSVRPRAYDNLVVLLSNAPKNTETLKKRLSSVGVTDPKIHALFATKFGTGNAKKNTPLYKLFQSKQIPDNRINVIFRTYFEDRKTLFSKGKPKNLSAIYGVLSGSHATFEDLKNKLTPIVAKNINNDKNVFMKFVATAPPSKLNRILKNKQFTANQIEIIMKRVNNSQKPLLAEALTLANQTDRIMFESKLKQYVIGGNPQVIRLIMSKFAPANNGSGVPKNALPDIPPPNPKPLYNILKSKNIDNPIIKKIFAGLSTPPEKTPDAAVVVLRTAQAGGMRQNTFDSFFNSTTFPQDLLRAKFLKMRNYDTALDAFLQEKYPHTREMIKVALDRAGITGQRAYEIAVMYNGTLGSIEGVPSEKVRNLLKQLFDAGGAQQRPTANLMRQIRETMNLIATQIGP